MNSPHDTPSGPGWWRRQAPWLIGAMLLGAWALYGPYIDAWRGYARDHPLRPIDVAQGASVDYEGARWRLLNVTTREQQRAGREDAVVLVARFELVAASGTTAKSLDRCKGRISDLQERHWEADAFHQLGVKNTLPDSCGSGRGPNSTTLEARPGEPFQFEQVYQVPRALDAHTLQPEIFMPWPERASVGTYLRFSQ